jgi:hypothetical protein
MNLDGLPSHIPDRREAILGGCGENVLFSTLRRMTRETRSVTGADLSQIAWRQREARARAERRRAKYPLELQMWMGRPSCLP